MPRKGGRRRKTRTHVVEAPGNEKDDTPRSFVFKMGKIPAVIQTLVQDMRRVMAPFTADKLREKRKNTIKDFVAVGAPMGITHLMFFTHTDAGTNLKLARIPRGPTLSFKVVNYSLMRQLHATHKRPVDTSLALKTTPLVVLNNFTGDADHLKLMNATFQHLFPPIDVQTVALSECRRVVLFNYEKETDTVVFRQFVIRATPLGISKSVKTIVRAKIPNLSTLEDISEFVVGGAGGGMTSDSEVDDVAAHVTLPTTFRGRGNTASETGSSGGGAKSAVRLTEIGPRLTLKLTKVEREICAGDVLYHAYVEKSPEATAADKAKKEQAEALKRKRREEQDANVAKKQDAKEQKKQRKLDRKVQAKADELDETTAPAGSTTDKGKRNGKRSSGDNDSDVDDREYYRQEVGEDPDEHTFAPKAKKQKVVGAAATKAPVVQLPGQKAPSDKARRFGQTRPGGMGGAAAAKPKGKVVRQRQQKGGAGGGSKSGGKGGGKRKK